MNVRYLWHKLVGHSIVWVTDTKGECPGCHHTFTIEYDSGKNFTKDNGRHHTRVCLIAEPMEFSNQYERYVKWKFDPNTDIMVASADYNYIYLKKTRDLDMVWWIIQSSVDTFGTMVLRDQDFNDLKRIFERLIVHEPDLVPKKFMEMKHK